MSKLLTYGSVGGAPGNRCSYPEQAEETGASIETIAYRMTCKDGWVRDVAISGTAFNGQLLATLVDLTELKSVREQFETFFNLVSDIFCIAGFDGYFQLINPAACDILGYGMEELLARPYMEFVHPEDREGTAGVIQDKIRRGETIHRFKNRYICRDGSVKWLEWTSHAIADKGVMFAAGRDCTERLKMEAALKESEIWMRNIFNALKEAVLVVSPERELLNVNRAAEKMFGYTAEELSDKSTGVFHVDHAHYMEFGERIEAAFDRGVAAEFEFRAKRKNGDIFPTEHAVSLLKDDAGNTLGIVSVIRDISKRKQQEDELRKMLSELERSNRELQQFAYVASHDLQEPLRAIAGFLQLLQTKYGDRLDAKGHQYIERSVNASHRMQALIQDMLKLSGSTPRGNRWRIRISTGSWHKPSKGSRHRFNRKTPPSLAAGCRMRGWTPIRWKASCKT